MSASSSSTKREDRTRLEGFELEIFKLVREGATSEQWREWLRVPLEHAAADGNVDLFVRLMDAGAHVTSAGWRGCHGRTLLGAAARGKHEEMVIALLRAGAKDDVNVKFGAEQESALHVAAAHGAEGSSRALMFAGADPFLLNSEGNTPLHLAAREGHDGVVSDLLLRVDVDVKGNRENTPLHFAAEAGRVSCVSTLLLGGAEKDQRNTFEDTPLHLAAENSQVEVVEELLAAQADPEIRRYIPDHYEWHRPLDVAAECGNSDVLRAILRYGGDVTACDRRGCTALHHAAFNLYEGDLDTSDVVRVLLEAGADVDAKAAGFESATPLRLAASKNPYSIGTMCALLEGGADVNARDEGGSTPLHQACRRSNISGVELLLRWGADETLVDEDGQTAEGDVGSWEHDVNEDCEGAAREGRKADDRRIRHMLARAPADRSWRRRGWLVLARSHRGRAQLAHDSRSSNGGSSAKVAKAGSGGTRDKASALAFLMDSVVAIDAEDVFRLIVRFL
eukprot:g2294.t1